MINRIQAKLIRFLHSFFYLIVCSLIFFVFLVFFSVKFEGRENIPKRGRFIVAANHQNFFDGFFLVFAVNPFRRLCFVITKRAMKSIVFRYLARLIGSVLIGTKNEEYQIALKKLNNTLTHGGSVGIFPEGDISSHKLPRKFKGGVAKLSLDSKTKVVPVYINGTFELRYANYWLKRSPILVKIGKPIELYNFAKACNDDLDQMANIVREKIIELSEVKEIVRLEPSVSPDMLHHQINPVKN